MTRKLKAEKTTLKMSRKSITKALTGHRIGQKHVGKFVAHSPMSRDVERLKINLRQMVESIKARKNSKNIPAYETIAEHMSALAGLSNGHVWGWRYVASVMSGSTFPSKKFIDTCKFYFEQFNPNKKQYFYFVYRSFFSSVYSKTIRAEIIRSHMRAMNFREVTYSEYMQVRKRK